METKKIENLIGKCYEDNKAIANANNGPMMKYLSICEVGKDFKSELEKFGINSKSANKIYTAICYSDDKKIEQIKQDFKKYICEN